MKTALLALAVCLAVMFVYRPGFTVSQPHNVGYINTSSSTASGGTGLWLRTVSQINALTATATGQILICTNCTVSGTGRADICISTGMVTVAQFQLSSGTPCR
jgi:hypothetical protein